jgi:hypothetical protein
LIKIWYFLASGSTSKEELKALNDPPKKKGENSGPAVA